MESNDNVENVHENMAEYQVSIQIEERLGNLPPTSPVKHMFKIHNQLRMVNEKAYEPKYVGIGPYHYKCQHYMEKQKIYYLKQMLGRNSQNSVGRYLRALREIEVEIRQQYDGIDTLSPEEFIQIMLLDGCFILEYMMYICQPSSQNTSRQSNMEALEPESDPPFSVASQNTSRQSNMEALEPESDPPFSVASQNTPRQSNMEALQPGRDPLFSVDWIHRCIKSDLLLLENQLPFKVLTTLYDMTKNQNEQRNLIDLVKNVFVYAVNRSSRQHGYNHLLDVVYQLYFPTPQTTSSERPRATNPTTSEEGEKPASVFRSMLRGPCAGRDTNPKTSKEGEKPASVFRSMLRGPCAGRDTIPKTSKEGKSSSLLPFLIPSAKELEESGIKFSSKGSDIEFDNGTLKIPPICIDYNTDSLIRNLIAYEQQCRGGKTKCVTEYAHFLDCLINTPKDVELLRQNKIITNLLGDDEAVSKIFNRISDNVPPYHKCSYASVFRKVNEHCSKRRNRWIAIWWRDHFHSPWSIISFLAATVLLLLTLIQTVYTVTCYYKKD